MSITPVNDLGNVDGEFVEHDYKALWNFLHTCIFDDSNELRELVESIMPKGIIPTPDEFADIIAQVMHAYET